MSFRDWLPHPAIGVGIAVAAALAIAGALNRYNDSYQKPDTAKAQSAQEQTAEQLPTITPNGKKVDEADRSKPECSKPQNHDEADLCQQRRMAEAAERSVTLSQWQIILGVIGAGLILWTLRYNKQAAEAAVVAAQATAASVDIARKSLQFSFGAKLDIEDFKIETAIRRFVIQFTTKNFGKADATIINAFQRFHIGQKLPDSPNYAGESQPAMQGVIVEPNGRLVFDDDPQRNKTLDPKVYDAIIHDKVKYFIYGMITYHDVFGTVFELGYSRQVEVNWVSKTEYRCRLIVPTQYIGECAQYDFRREKKA